MIENDTAYRIKSVTFALNNLNRVNQNVTIGKSSGVMSHLLNKDFQIHHIDTISRILIVYTLVIVQIEFL